MSATAAVAPGPARSAMWPRATTACASRRSPMPSRSCGRSRSRRISECAWPTRGGRWGGCGETRPPTLGSRLWPADVVEADRLACLPVIDVRAPALAVLGQQAVADAALQGVATDAPLGGDLGDRTQHSLHRSRSLPHVKASCRTTVLTLAARCRTMDNKKAAADAVGSPRRPVEPTLHRRLAMESTLSLGWRRLAEPTYGIGAVGQENGQ